MNLHVLNAILPKAPWDLQEEVELYARESGRTAKLHFMPGINTWFARFSLRSNDKRMLAYQQGLAADVPTEDVWFHRAASHEDVARNRAQKPGDWIPLDIIQMGRSGVREFLDRGNTWSGRGEFASIAESRLKAKEANAAAKERLRAQQKDDAMQMTKQTKHHRLKIPVIPVAIDLKERTGS